MRRTLGRLLVIGLAASLAACGAAPLGKPPRVSTHGFRAHAMVKRDGVAKDFEIAVRGHDRRRDLPAKDGGRVTIWKGGEKKVFEMDPATRTFWERPFTSLDEVIPEHPLEAGFTDKKEAARRGVEEYHRESDTVFSGHVANIWRFDDQYDDPASASTSYWAVPTLDGLVLKVSREAPSPEGLKVVWTSELTNVRPGADPLLFTTQDFKKVDAPADATPAAPALSSAAPTAPPAGTPPAP